MDGKLKRRKARVVAKRFAQRPGIDFFQTFAPVARLSLVRVSMALATKYDLKISQIDIETAYLNVVWLFMACDRLLETNST